MSLKKLMSAESEASLSRTGEQREDHAPRYEQRLVAFVDVLGWSSLVRRSVEHPEEIAGLNIASSYLSFVPQGTAKMREFFAKHDVEDPIRIDATHFSDSLVLSCPLKTPATNSLMSQLQLTCMSLLYSGRYTRGAVVVGLIYHRENVLFGPALLEAVRIEREVAKYPRIVVAPEALPFVDPKVIVEKTKETRFRNVRLDQDGLHFVDILGFGAGRKDEPRRLSGGEDRLVETTKERLNRDEGDLNRYAKHMWMLKYLEDVKAEAK